MPELNDTIHCRCSKEFKLVMQASANLTGLSDGDYIRKAITLLNQQVQQEMTNNDRPEPVSNPEPTE